MAYSPYNPNYQKLYPGVNINPQIKEVLEKSDRKMEYMDVDLKRKRRLRDKYGKAVLDRNGQAIEIPSKETSLETMLTTGNPLPRHAESAENEYLHNTFPEMDELYRCFELLDEQEKKLIIALFFDRMTHENYALTIGKSSKYVQRELKKILAKIKMMWDA